MLKEERLNFILQKLTTNQKVRLDELSADLKVSADTIRRDVALLSRNGLLMKVRGGAIPHSPNAHSFKERIHISENNKQIIAQKALAFIKPKQTILLDGGTTTFTLASLLPRDIELTVITNNIPIAALLTDHPRINIILTGGKVFKDSQVTLGTETIRLLQQLRVEIYFIGVCSLHYEIGVSATDYEEAEVKRAMVQAANRVIAVSTKDKIGTAESYKVCEITALESIITESSCEDDLFKPYKTLGIQIF